MVNEKIFRTWLKDKLAPHAMVTKIETMTISGVPDLHTIANKIDCWIECKSVDSDCIKMRVSQWNWMRKYVGKHKGHYALIIHRPKTGHKRPRTVIDVYLGTTLCTKQMQQFSNQHIRGDFIFWNKEETKPDFTFTQPVTDPVIQDLIQILYNQKNLPCKCYS